MNGYLLKQLQDSVLNQVSIRYYWTECNGKPDSPISNIEDKREAERLVAEGIAKPISESIRKNYHDDWVEIRVELTIQLVDRPEPVLNPDAKWIFTGPAPSSQWNYTADPEHPGDSSQWVG